MWSYQVYVFVVCVSAKMSKQYSLHKGDRCVCVCVLNMQQLTQLFSTVYEGWSLSRVRLICAIWPMKTSLWVCVCGLHQHSLAPCSLSLLPRNPHHNVRLYVSGPSTFLMGTATCTGASLLTGEQPHLAHLLRTTAFTEVRGA